MSSRSRSRSRTADTAPSRVTDSSANLNSAPRASPAPASSATTPISPENRDLKQRGMISTVTRQSSATPLELPAQINNDVTSQQDNMQDDADDRSSSLSELEDADDPLDAASADQLADLESDYDTEAETERLERTPQKLNVPLNNSLLDKTPSKLAQEVTADDSSTPTANGHDIIDAEDEDVLPSTTLFQSNGQGAEQEESPSRKRKRSESAISSLSDTDEPLAKRAQSARFQGVPDMSSTETLVGKAAATEPEEDAPGQETDLPAATSGDQETEAPEPTLPTKGRKGRKGKRKGRRAANDDVETNGDDLAAQEEQDVDEDEEDSNRDEEVARKRLAIDAFAKIEKEFTAFREKHVKQQLSQITQELELLRQPSSTHPEYLAQLRCIDDYRDKKIRYEDVLYKLKHQALQVRTVSERQQLHSQYFQQARDVREQTIQECWENMYALQKDRRKWGAEEHHYAQMFQPKRAQQISHQASYNLEVSILSGVAKHVGFPAAPVLPTLHADNLESDFKLMRIPDRPLQPRISLRDVERNAADTSFYEQNAWANPSIAQMVPAQPFGTPGVPNRIVSNGSTIDVGMMSAQHSQHPTPQNPVEAVLGGAGRAPAQLDSSPLAVSAAPIASVLSATAFPTSALHGTDAKTTPQAPPAISSISVGGSSRFAK